MQMSVLLAARWPAGMSTAPPSTGDLRRMHGAVQVLHGQLVQAGGGILDAHDPLGGRAHLLVAARGLGLVRSLAAASTCTMCAFLFWQLRPATSSCMDWLTGGAQQLPAAPWASTIFCSSSDDQSVLMLLLVTM